MPAAKDAIKDVVVDVNMNFAQITKVVFVSYRSYIMIIQISQMPVGIPTGHSGRAWTNMYGYYMGCT